MHRVTFGLVLTCALRVGAEPGWYQVEFSYPVNAVAVQSESEAWAVGAATPNVSGFLHWNGATWTLGDTFRNHLVYDIDYAGADVWAVGEQLDFPDGVVYRWAGQHWQQEPDPFDRTLHAISFPDSAHGYAAGAALVTQHPVMRYADGVWQIDSLLTTPRTILGLFSPWFNKCYAVGDSGAIFRFDYDTWTRSRSPTTQALRRVKLESNTEGWAVGDNGTILRCFKDTWAQVASPTTRNLRGLAIASNSGEVWAVGDSGTILHCVMGSWHLEPYVPDPPDVTLYTVSFNSGTHGWAFGFTPGRVVALHYFDQVAIEERVTRSERTLLPACVVRGVLELPQASSRKPQAASWLLDISGGKLLDLHPGANDISRLAPGVYFLRQTAGNQRAGTARVVVAR